MTHEELVAYLEHVAYEITGVVTSYILMSKINEYGKSHPIGEVGETNDCLDLMALHFRNLHEFFCDSPRTGYVRAVNYTPSFTLPRNNSLISKANLQTAHLTEERHRIAQDHQRKSWNPNEVMKWLVTTTDQWMDNLEQDYLIALQQQLRSAQGFIDWYRDQIDNGAV